MMISYHDMTKMSRDDKKSVRITIWPGVLLPHPPVPHRGWRLEGERLIPSRSSPGGGGVGTREQVLEVEELYLELLHVDVERAEEIVDFANRFDVVGIREAADTAARPETPLQVLLNRELGPPTGSETLAEFRFAARYLRELTYSWLFISINRGPKGTWPLLRETLGLRAEKEVTLRDLNHFLAHGVSAGTIPFHPRLSTDDAAAPDLLQAPLYSTCCLELYNHIVEGATYQRCRNPSCYRLFVRQKGRAEKGQHRSEGLKYCSKQCARVQAQRDYRTRAKAKKPPNS